MKFQDTIRPIDTGVSKAILLGISIIIIAVGASIFTMTYLLASSDMTSTFYGAVLVWVGGLVFFYAVITEEHTMKELFLRQGYFVTGLLTMILGLFFIGIGGINTTAYLSAVEFGILLLILGAALIIFSAQRTRDYSKRSSLMAVCGGAILTAGGVMTGDLNISYGGVFIIILGVMWFGLRSWNAD